MGFSSVTRRPRFCDWSPGRWHRSTVTNARLTVVTCLALVLCACSMDRTTRGTPMYKTYNADGLSFRYPHTWMAEPYGNHPRRTFGTPIVYLSTTRLHDPCVTNGSLTSCGLPLDTVPPGGIFITWSTVGYPTGSPIVSSPNTTIGARAARISMSLSSLCIDIHAIETLTADIQLQPPNSEFKMMACLGGPDTSGNAQKVRSMLKSVVISSGA